ncbi:MAG: hypothetical protein AAF745_13430, partial [Planctomycetota bacterium]
MSAQVLGTPDPGGQSPPQAYYTARRLFRDGDLDSALDAIDVARRSTRTDPTGKWLDSIPIFALAAECQWHLGDLAGCMATTDEVIRIAVRNRGWLSSVRWDALNRPVAAMAATRRFWPEANAVIRAPVPQNMQVAMGSFLTEQRLLQGGAIEAPSLKNIDVAEILRGLATISYRRRVILGPLSNQEPLVGELLEATKYPADLASPLGKTLIGATRGVEYFAIREDKTVLDRINRYATAGGSVHPITPAIWCSGLSIGCAGDDRQQISEAASAKIFQLAQSIANASAALEQFEWIGEALQLAAGSVVENQLPAVERSAMTAAGMLVRESRLASLHCYLVAADAAIRAGRIDAAEAALQSAMVLANRRDVRWPRLQAYGAYVAAKIAAARGGQLGVAGSGQLNTTMASMSQFITQGGFTGNARGVGLGGAGGRRSGNRAAVIAMPWNYQLGVLRARVGRNLGNQSARQIIAAFSEAADIARWRRDPVDAIASHLTNAADLYSVLLNTAAMSNQSEETLVAADRLIASRFFSQLPLEGRLLQLRTIISQSDADCSAPQLSFLKQAPPALTRIRDQVRQELNPAAALGPPNANGQDEAGIGISTAAAAGVSIRSAVAASHLESQLSSLALRRMVVPPA